MTTSQFFVYRRPVAWTALVACLAWGAWAYVRMPQRQDPVIPIRNAAITTLYPGADPQKVREQVTRRIERKLVEHDAIQKIHSVSREGQSTVYVELYGRVKAAGQVWQELRSKLGEITDLPAEASRPQMNSEFGDTAAVFLTLSSPQVSDFELDLRARSIRSVLAAHRAARPADLQPNRLAGIIVFPSQMSREAVLRLGRQVMEAMSDKGVVRDTALLEAPSAVMVDFQLAAPRAQFLAELERWRLRHVAPGQFNPDLWPVCFVGDLDQLPAELRRVARDKYTFRELHDFADVVRDFVKKYPDAIGRVSVYGVQDEQVYLDYSSHRLAQMQIDPRLVLGALAQRNADQPGGQVQLTGQELTINPSGELQDEREIGAVIYKMAGPGLYPVFLRDLVDITRGYNDPPRPLNVRVTKVDRAHPPTARLPSEQHFQQGLEPLGGAAGEPRPLPDPYDLQTTRAITLAIYQVPGSQVDQLNADLDQALGQLRGLLPDDLVIERTSNQPAEVKHKIELFSRSLLEAVGIVIVVCLVFMEWRSAVLVALSIPLVVCMTLGLCHLAGIDLQQISIAALIIALGLLVDDPVVAADAINRHIAAGEPREVAAWNGPQQISRAILYATLTNVVAFLPLLLVKDKVGDFIFSLPVVVCTALVCSRFASMTFMPLLGSYLLRGQNGLDVSEDGTTGAFSRAYRRAITWCVAHRWATLGVAVGLLGVATSQVVHIGRSFFPSDEHSLFWIDAYTSEGSSLKFTAEKALDVVREVEALEGPNIRSYTLFIGQGSERFWLSAVPEARADNYCQLLVETTDARSTNALCDRLKRRLPDRLPDHRVVVNALLSGPPVGLPVQLQLFGDDVAVLRRLSAEIRSKLAAVPGVNTVFDDWDPDIMQVDLQIDFDKASMVGITSYDVANFVRSAFTGFTATVMKVRDRQLQVTFRLRPEERSQLSDLMDLTVVSLATNQRVPLRSIARFQAAMVPPKLRTRKHQYCLTVKADLVPGVLASTITNRLQRDILPTVSFPPGYSYDWDGEKYQTDLGFGYVRVALVVSLLAIYLALVLQFNSVTKPLLVYAAVPFGMVGGLMGLLVTGQSFGFMAFLGIASLAGVIVSHIIVLFEYVEELRERGRGLRESVIDAGLARLRPVLTTIFATVLALVPLAVEGGPLWQPMCYVQIAGLLTATVVTLVLVPVLYVVFVENLRLVRWDRAADGPPPAAPGAPGHSAMLNP